MGDMSSKIQPRPEVDRELVNRNLQIKIRNRPLATLEKLPNEILHEIFLYNCNINLPLASPELAARLSCSYIYDRFLYSLFNHVLDENCKVWHVEETTPRFWQMSFSCMRNRALRCRWLTWELFDANQRHVLDEFSKYLVGGKAQTSADGLSSSVKSFVTKGWSHAERNRGQIQRRRFYIGPQTFIPARLVRVPCQDGQFKFLRALVKGRACLQYMWSSQKSNLEELWCHALRTKDYRLVDTLSWSRELISTSLMHAEYIRHAMEERGQDLVMANLLRCKLFKCKWRRLVHLATCIRCQDATAQPLVKVFLQHVNNDISGSAKLLELLTSKYAGDSEWYDDVVRLLDVPDNYYFACHCQ